MATAKKKEKKQRDAKGLFAKGNTIGKAYEFKPGNTASKKYDPSMCERVLRYFTEHEGYPTFEAFAALELGINLHTVKAWADTYPEFRDAWEQAKQIQLAKLQEGTMLKRYDASFAKFLAINNHGMSEKSQIDIGNKDEEGFKVTVTVDD